jgi:hypothetical protein
MLVWFVVNSLFISKALRKVSYKKSLLQNAKLWVVVSFAGALAVFRPAACKTAFLAVLSKLKFERTPELKIQLDAI